MTAADPLRTLARGVVGVGFDGSTVGAAPFDALRALAPGTFVLFARNAGSAGDLRDLVAALRATSSPPPLIAVDQEGGRVERIHDGVASLPPAMAVGAANDVALTERLGVLVGRDLARLGITVNLAPVADLASEPAATAVATRAYGDEPLHVAAHAGAFARGLERGGVAATLKHFPGHGSTDVDSHAALPRVDVAENALRARDLVPFARAIAAREASLVLVAHVVATAFDALRAASLSDAVTTRLLRDDLGFDGVTITDCLEMGAIAAGDGTVRAAPAALAAGADIVLISHRLDVAERVVDAIVGAVHAGTLPRARLEDAHARVLRLRERYTQPAPYDGDVDGGAPAEAARRAVTAVRGEARLREGKPVTVISFEGAAADAAAASGALAARTSLPSLSAPLRRRGWKSENMRVALAPDDDDVTLLLQHVAALGDREFVAVTRDAHLHPAQRDAVARLLDAAPHVTIVSARAPFDAALWPDARRVVCIYGGGELSMEGCADVLSGRAPARGTLPVRLARDAAVR